MTEKNKEKRLHLLVDILRVLRSTHQHEEVFFRIVDLVTRIHPCQSVAVVLINEATEYLEIGCSYGISHLFQKSFRQKISTGVIGELLWNGKPIVIVDSIREPAKAKEVQLENEFGSCVCLPIGSDHRTSGYLYVSSDVTHAFDVDDVTFLQACADVAGIAYQKCRLAEENLRMDRIDHETGTEKYSAFQERLQAALDRGSQYQESFAVLLCDIDNFKSISNTYGSAVSRQLLKDMADLLRKELRAIDAAGRFGFDEFILLQEKVGAEDATSFADRVREKVERASFTAHEIKSTISVGVAVFPKSGRTIDDLMLTAKKALFEAQKTGRNRVVFFPDVWYERRQKSLDIR